MTIDHTDAELENRHPRRKQRSSVFVVGGDLRYPKDPFLDRHKRDPEGRECVARSEFRTDDGTRFVMFWRGGKITTELRYVWNSWTTIHEVPVDLPGLGVRPVRPCSYEPGHWLWLSSFGWHDCTPTEDQLCRDAVLQGSVP